MRIRRFATVAGLSMILAGAWASPALAHGGGGPDASNFRSAVTDVVVLGPDGQPARPATVPVQWNVLANDSLLVVESRADAELTVPGYDGEPYLRIGPEGVWENRNSPAAYLNNDRYAQTAVPPGVAPDAEPDWVKVADEPSYGWHDHRIHWMAATMPPQAKTDPTAQTVVLDWTVPFSLDGRQLAVQGQLRWIPPSPWWPWVIGALLATITPVAVGFATASGERRERRMLRMAGVVLAAVVALDVIHAIDDVVAMPATIAEDIWALLQSGVFIAMGGWGALRAWQAREAGEIALAVGAGALFLGIGLGHVSSLTSSQMVTVLPAAFTRAVVAANLAVVVPAAWVAWHVNRRVTVGLEEPSPSHEATS